MLKILLRTDHDKTIPALFPLNVSTAFSWLPKIIGSQEKRNCFAESFLILGFILTFGIDLGCLELKPPSPSYNDELGNGFIF